MKFTFVFLLLCVNILTYASPFDTIRPMAEKGLSLVELNDKQTALDILQESFIRGYDWLESPEEIEIMGNVVAYVISLRHELKGEDMQTLMLDFMLRSAIETVNREEYTYELMPNVYPAMEVPVNITSGSVNENLKNAISMMVSGEMAECERLLLALYNHTWSEGKDSGYRHTVANKLILFYLRLGLLDNAYKLIRQNKIDMDKHGIVDKAYIETLAYKGFVLRSKGSEILGTCNIEVAENLCHKLNYPPDEIMADYSKVMNSQLPSHSQNNAVAEFIRENDHNFCFLTESEREQRWNVISTYWESLKSSLIAGHDAVVDFDAVLNAFQYEKQLMLRSTVKVRDAIRQYDDEKLINQLDTLRHIKLQMASSFGRDWNSLNASYQRVQKDLLHQANIKSAVETLYHFYEEKDIKRELRANETFIDFGIISDDKGSRYYALVISPEINTKLVKLCTVDELDRFVSECQSENTSKTVSNLYDVNFLYENIWKPIAENTNIGERVYYCPAGTINALMLDAISHDNHYLGEEIAFHILSSWESMRDLRKSETYIPDKIATFCDIDYVGNREALILDAQKYGASRPLRKHFFDRDETPGNFRSAFSNSNSIQPISSIENYKWLDKLAETNGVDIFWYSGAKASEYAFKNFQNWFKGTLNIATHAFCFPKDVEVLGQPYLMRHSLNTENTDGIKGVPLPMFRCGLLLSGSERVWCGRNIIDDIDDGILNGEEISSLDLSGIELVTLMACSTGNGDIDEREGVFGLRRALKMAGCGSMVTTAWNVDKEVAGVYMKVFYTALMNGDGISVSHRKAQLELIKRYEYPYYWSVFQLVD